MSAFEIRLIQPTDSVGELTALLNRSYQRLADMGFNYTAATQSEAVTRERIEDNVCFVAIADRRIVGTALLIPHRLEMPKWADQPDVAYAGQLGVDAEYRNRGIGAALMDAVENRAHELGFHTIAGDTSEGADYLLRMYEGRGYKIVDYHQWRGKTYRSVVLAKQLSK